MRFIATLATGAACLATAFAQVNIAFTSVPEAVVVGQPANITWAGGDGVTPVTITLRRGDPQNLQTIATLTSTGVDGYFLWTPDASLATASDYALQITQGQSDINYSGPFALIGGTGSSSISYSGTSTLPPASVNATITSVTTVASIGTGAPISRNTTFSSQTLTSTSSETSSRTTSRSATGSSTAAETAATSAPTGGAAHMASSLALVFGVVAAIASLN
ncbi:hypothetical protein EPUS_02200 [Endocarpon pusillum Z07020]|uniref:Yeast cell wall synthesis Kre9/Knh1-like N-terminal domain-containing protein n=1 Tax=Endocarpon pusillum (strain Z07020 / HMAS-L-300199) TaxID=1263415 RepID=U1GJI3_ENDPU|nr:uncharacterized protein EPUS_02200 [Endocarpon pusillum Z07020]ERF72313.1 hypothetical protein EPUS_02200 [Endocarpon pusillum Z07020]